MKKQNKPEARDGFEYPELARIFAENADYIFKLNETDLLHSGKLSAKKQRELRQFLDQITSRMLITKTRNIFAVFSDERLLQLMIRELEILSRSARDADVTTLRRDFTLYGNDFVRDAASFCRDVEKTAKRNKQQIVTMIAVIR